MFLIDELSAPEAVLNRKILKTQGMRRNRNSTVNSSWRWVHVDVSIRLSC